MIAVRYKSAGTTKLIYLSSGADKWNARKRARERVSERGYVCRFRFHMATPNLQMQRSTGGGGDAKDMYPCTKIATQLHIDVSTSFS